MKILIDSFVLDRRFRHQGSYVYARNVIEAFLRLDGPDVPEFTVLVSSEPSSDAHQFRAKPGVELVKMAQLTSLRSWRLGGAGLATRAIAADAIYCPAPINCAFHRAPAVVTIHDATAVKAPSQKWLKNTLEHAIIWSAARFSKKVITDSENSKRDLMQIYGVPEEKISVIYLGYDARCFRTADPNSTQEANIRKRYGIERPYVLHHGLVQPRKNLQRLIEACRLLLERYSDLDLEIVLAGAMGWQSEEIIRTINAGAARGKVILTGPVPQQDLAELIRGAALCVIPSLYEGFCLPLLECMACGTPTIASGSSCLPEISGGVLRYFDPLSVEEMTEAIYEGMCDGQLRRRLSEQGLRQASQFSWERCARETLSVLTGLVSSAKCEPSPVFADTHIA